MRKISPNFYVLTDSNSDLEFKALKLWENWQKEDGIFQFKSSGSTGEPKLVQFSKKDLIDSANRTNKFFKSEKEDWALSNLPLEFVGGAMVLIRALIGNYSVLLIEPKEDLSESLSSLKQNFQFASFLPNQWHYLFDKKELLERIFLNSKAILIGGAAFPLPLLPKTQNLNLPIFSTYGMTETVSHIALKQIAPVYSNYFTCLPGIEVKILPDESLEIIIEDSGKTFLTNDLVEIIDKNKFNILGRKDHVINSGGLKIHPNIFDQIMSEFFENIEVSISYFFFGFKDEKYGEILYLALETTDKQLENKLMNELKMHFPQKYLPKKIIFIKQFEKTWNGKIDIPSTLKKYGEI